MKDWEHTRACEVQRGCYDGHNQTGTISHNANITAKRDQGCESNWEKHTSAEKCVLVSKDPHHFLTYTFSMKGTVENLESHLVSTADSHSSHSECSIQLNIHSNMSEDQKFKNEGKDSQCNQLEGSFGKGSVFFKQQIFFPSSKICNVDNNGRDFIQTSMINAYGDIVNAGQLFMCHKMIKVLCKSSSCNNYKSLYDGVRKYLFNETGHNVDQGSSLMKHQGNQFLDNDSGSNKCRNIFYQRADVSLYKSVDIGKKAYNCSEYSKVPYQSCKLIQQQSIQNVEKHYKCNTCGKIVSKSLNLSSQRKIHTESRPFKCTECGKAFICPLCPTQHQQTHTGERPYTCKECGKGYTCCSNFTQH